MQRGLIGTLLYLLRDRSYIAIGLVTVLTLGVVAAVVLTTTSVGCSPAHSLGVKTARCTTTPKPVAVLGSPSPTSTPTAVSPVNPGASSPSTPVSSNNPPYNPGSSNNPPYNPANSGFPAYVGPDSGSYPPMAYPGSGNQGPGLTLSCRLPVYSGGSGSGGFIEFPGGTFVADPRSAVTVPSPSPTAPPPGMGYPGFYGWSYDPAPYSKWLPVPFTLVSPDGAHYAYPLNGNVYVQSVSGGAQIVLGAGKGYVVIAVENNGVYAEPLNQPGLWFLPFSGTEKQVTTGGFWQAESHGAAYGTITSSVPSGATNTILKLDTATGSTSDFFTLQGGQSNVIGFDGKGNPVVRANYSGGAALYIATAPGHAAAIAATFYGPYAIFPQAGPLADSHGLWFSVANGVVLFTNNAWYWMSSLGAQLAGACT
ncbi:MAG TPA: hypothetical protein VJQ08_12075 [Candidatus Dormibacteraeota bacterium]|nr:hypothetical protein [Candidatus Dormibacteraeota bacterium]